MVDLGLEMHITRLSTKLYRPQARSSQILRARLVSRINQGFEPGVKMILLAAPVGFGKTSLLAEWISHGSIPVAWLSLDEADSDPTRFWDYVVAALRTIYPGFGEDVLALLHEPTPLPIQSILVTLINELGANPDPCALVLDDYHVIATPAIHEALTFLLDHLPPQMRLVITTRIDPPLPLNRMRARGELIELRSADLRFTTDEAAEFIQRMTGLQLDGESTQTLDTRTEGWIAGLQLAALALRDHTNPSEFIAMFSGDHRYILDYLGEEVLDRQPPSVQRFLLQTSILERMSSAVCQAVTGNSQCQAILQSLERANFFVVPLDDRREWYRYHQLFHDFLRHRLSQDLSEEIETLHRRAIDWYEQNGFPNDAISHALAIHDHERAAELLENLAELLIWHRAEISTLLNWLNNLREDVIRMRPRLCLYHAWCLYLIGQSGAAARRVEDAERLIAGKEDSESTLLAGVSASISSTLTGIQQQFNTAIEHSRRALTMLPETEISWRCVAAINLGVASAAVGDLGEGISALSEAMELSQEIGSSFALLSTFWHMASLQSAQLRLREAEATCTQLLHIASRPDQLRFPVAGYIALLRGEMAIERNALDEASDYLIASADQVNPEAFPMALLRTYLAQARLARAIGDHTGMRSYLDRADQITTTHKLNQRSSPLPAYLARLWIEDGDLVSAWRWIEDSNLRIEEDFAYYREPYYLVYARLLLVSARRDPSGDHLDQASRLLERMIKRAEATGRTGSLIRALVLQVQVLVQQSETAAALQLLDRALCLAEPEGCIRTFVDEGPALAGLLPRLLEAQRKGLPVSAVSSSPDYIGKLMAAAGQTGMTARARRAGSVPLAEPLSSREMEVLGLMADGMNSGEIADRLVISVETARKHMKNIYSKLAVHSLFEAVRRAQELGLI